MHGSGAEAGTDTETCPDCGGSGAITQETRTMFGTMRQQQVCRQLQWQGQNYQGALPQMSTAAGA